MTKPALSLVRSPSFQVRKTLDVDDVRWATVAELLVTRHKMTFIGASHVVRAFMRKVRIPFHPRWFLGANPTLHEAAVVCAICEAHGADSVVLERAVDLSNHWLPLRYRLEIELFPAGRSGREGRRDEAQVKARCRLEMLHVQYRFDSAWAVLAINALLFALATAAYAVVFGALLYMGAVFTVFVGAPAATLSLAPRSFPICLALLGSLVGIGAVMGQLIRASLRAGRTLSRLISKPLGVPANDDINSVYSDTDGTNGGRPCRAQGYRIPAQGWLR